MSKRVIDILSEQSQQEEKLAKKEILEERKKQQVQKEKYAEWPVEHYEEILEFLNKSMLRNSTEYTDVYVTNVSAQYFHEVFPEHFLYELDNQRLKQILLAKENYQLVFGEENLTLDVIVSKSSKKSKLTETIIFFSFILVLTILTVAFWGIIGPVIMPIFRK